jgi:hypothetical protein
MYPWQYDMLMYVSDQKFRPNWHLIIEVFYDAQYDVYYRLKKDSYVIENDIYVRIWWLRLIIYYRFL